MSDLRDNDIYRGVKGWLLLLCLSLTFLDPLSMLFNLFVLSNLTRPYFETYKGLFNLILVNGIFTIGLVVFSIYAGVSLWRLTAHAVHTAKRYFMSIFFYSILTIFLPDIFGVSENIYKKFGGNNMLNSIITMCYATLWYIYLTKSKRVRYTYNK